jgi:predicted alpha/beta hydrolase
MRPTSRIVTTAAMAERDVAEEPVELRARDGYKLAATLFRRSGQRDPADVVVFNAGGGLSSARYLNFVRFLAAEGFPTLAYDYRGVGRSRPAALRGFDAGLEDWAEYDQAGAVDHLRALHPQARISSVSHSIGGLVACAAPNAGELAQMVFIGPHTGYWRDYATAWKWPMAFMWHAAMPAISGVVGYFPGRLIGLGDDFPLRFALQWARRRRADFALNLSTPEGARGKAALDRAAALAVPCMAISISDDPFAGETGVRRFLFALPRVSVVRGEIDAKATGRGRIGHFGFFSRRHAALWPMVSRFLAPLPAAIVADIESERTVSR